MIGACSLVGVIGGVKSADVNPQNYKNVGIISKQETMQNLMKYEFMQDAKQKSYSAFKTDVDKQFDKVLLTAYDESIEYAIEVDQLREKKAAIEKQQLEEADESLNDLVTALDALEDAADTISIIANDTPVVATVVLDAENRNTLERLVMGEAGNQGFIGAALVAQTIHDTMLHDNNFNVNSIRSSHGYMGSVDLEPNNDVKSAVAFIFDKGGMAVQHRLIYFYAPKVTSSDFHEKQKFIVKYGGHKFFDSWE